MTVNDEVERRWEEAAITWFKILSLCLPGGTEEDHNNLCQPLGRESNS
jgi:hypothetical protein